MVRSKKLLHGRHWHVRVKDVALSFPCPVRLLRHQHPLTVIEMRAIRPGNHVGPDAVPQIAAAIGAGDRDLNLGQT